MLALVADKLLSFLDHDRMALLVAKHTHQYTVVRVPKVRVNTLQVLLDLQHLRIRENIVSEDVNAKSIGIRNTRFFQATKKELSKFLVAVSTLMKSKYHCDNSLRKFPRVEARSSCSCKQTHRPGRGHAIHGHGELIVSKTVCIMSGHR